MTPTYRGGTLEVRLGALKVLGPQLTRLKRGPPCQTMVPRTRTSQISCGEDLTTKWMAFESLHSAVPSSIIVTVTSAPFHWFLTLRSYLIYYYGDSP